MLKRTKLVLSTLLVLGSTSLAFAGDQDLASLLATSGRIVPQVETPADVYAQVVKRKATPPRSNTNPNGGATVDRQLEGRL